MTINRNTISPGTVLWYRKKNSWDVDCLTVKEVGRDGFSFILRDGTVKKCTYKYASGRLYKDRSSLSSYAPNVELPTTYGGWSGRASYLGDPYDERSWEKQSPVPDDDGWIDQAMQHGADETW